MKHLVIFDLDGTIIDSVESLAYSVNHCLAAVGLPTNPTQNYKHYAGEGAAVMIQRSLIDAGDRELEHLNTVIAIYSEFFRKGCLYKATAYEGMKETLAQIKKMGVKLAVLTNKSNENAQILIHQVYGESFFDYILGQKPTHKRKPSTEGVDIILNTFTIKPSDCLFVGDTATDMQTGLSAGIFTVGVTWGFRDFWELKANNASAIVDKPSQLLDFI